MDDSAGRHIAEISFTQLAGKGTDAGIVADDCQCPDGVRAGRDDIQHGLRAGEIQLAHPFDIQCGNRQAARNAFGRTSGPSCGAADHAINLYTPSCQAITHHRRIAFAAHIQRPVEIRQRGIAPIGLGMADENQMAAHADTLDVPCIKIQ